MAKLRALLAGMMFGQYAVWGAWMPILAATLINRRLDPVSVGSVYAGMWLGCAVSPFLGGQLVDRRVPAQIFLAVTHLGAALVAAFLAFQSSATVMIYGMFAWSLLFAPGLGITNSLALHHLSRATPDEASREREFSRIRTAGTLGWIAASLLLTAYLASSGASASTSGPIPELLLASFLGVGMAVFSLFLPHTPPSAQAAGVEKADPLAFRRALELFRRVPGFGVFMAISFVAATEFQFFYVLSGPFLEDLSIPHAYIPAVKSLSQIAEIVALGVLLPMWLPSKGMKWCLLVGSFAWPLRYVIFAAAKPVELVVMSLALHGLGYAFVLVVQQIYVDRVAPPDIRASAQSLLTFVTLGLGNWLGSLVCGRVQAFYTTTGAGGESVTNWPPVFLIPAVTTLACALAYWLTFRDEQAKAPVEGLGQAEVRTLENG